ncbi:MAG: FAD/NAD(P)-binding protein [Methylococcales bacterium]
MRPPCDALAGSKNGDEIIMLEKDPELLGRGVAYHHDFTHQPLNVVAAGMSLFPDQPNHFVKWLEQNGFRYNHLLPSVSPKTFVPRKIFGDYIVEHLEKAHHEHATSLQIRIDEVLAIERKNEKLRATLESGIVLLADHVVLALGNFPPGDLFPGNEAVTRAPGYFANPWTDQVYAHITGNENILLPAVKWGINRIGKVQLMAA